jgi:hypothetical protein
METDINPTGAEKLRKGLAAMSDGSATLKTWALSVFGGSIAAFIGSDYLKPTGCAKLLYLAFIPGWALLGVSLYYADQLSASFMASIFSSNNNDLVTIGTNMNGELAKQKNFLSYALIPFGIWIVLFLLWWVFSPDKPPTANT